MTKICVFTSTRADYGILTPLIEGLSADRTFELRLFVTGTHLLKEHGYTVQEIRTHGYKPFYEVPIDMNDSSKISHLETMGIAIPRFANELSMNKPDVAVVLGDRFEALSFAVACNGLGIPLVHLHGGEVTEGALDEAYRHCITKLSCYHFVAAEKYRERVISMGEEPERVFNVGALGVDNIKRTALLSRAELQQLLGIELKQDIIVVTYHPETLNPDMDDKQVSALLDALKERLNAGNTSVIFTRANADHGNLAVHKEIEKFVSGYPALSTYVYSLGMKRYLSLVAQSTMVVGNSSSGIIEAPALGTPTVNIGARQKGREMAESIFNVSGNVEEISNALAKATQFKSANRGKTFSVYGNGTAAEQILNNLRTIPFSFFPKKLFFDRNV